MRVSYSPFLHQKTQKLKVDKVERKDWRKAYSSENGMGLKFFTAASKVMLLPSGRGRYSRAKWRKLTVFY